jgi:hypothetical protein
MTARMKRMTARMKRMTARMKRMAARMKRMTARMKRMTAIMKRMATKMKRMTARLSEDRNFALLTSFGTQLFCVMNYDVGIALVSSVWQTHGERSESCVCRTLENESNNCFHSKWLQERLPVPRWLPRRFERIIMKMT